MMANRRSTSGRVREVVGSSKMMSLALRRQRLGNLDELPLTLAEFRHRRRWPVRKYRPAPGTRSVCRRICARLMKGRYFAGEPVDEEVSSIVRFGEEVEPLVNERDSGRRSILRIGPGIDSAIEPHIPAFGL